MPDKEKVIETLEKAKTVIEGWVPMFEQYNTPAGIDYAIDLLKEHEEIKEQFIKAFNTIRDAYNTPANREKILLNYLLRNACCCSDVEREEGR